MCVMDYSYTALEGRGRYMYDDQEDVKTKKAEYWGGPKRRKKKSQVLWDQFMVITPRRESRKGSDLQLGGG